MNPKPEEVIHANRVNVLRALDALEGNASIRELHIFLDKNTDRTVDLPGILHHSKSMDSVLEVTEREPAEGHEVEGLNPHDVKITDQTLVDTILWAYDHNS